MSRLHYYRFDYRPELGERLAEAVSHDGEVGVFVTRWQRGESGVLRFDDGVLVAAFAEEMTHVGSEEVPL